jgi:hypothetical protein
MELGHPPGSPAPAAGEDQVDQDDGGGEEQADEALGEDAEGTACGEEIAGTSYVPPITVVL